MRKILSLGLVLCLLSVIHQGICTAAEWKLPVKYDMSYGNLKAYRYGPMLGGIGTGGLSFNTSGLCNFTLFNYALNEGNLDGGFFAVYVKSGDKKVVRFLQSCGRGVSTETGSQMHFERGVGAEIGGEVPGQRVRRSKVGEQLGADYGQKMVSAARCYSLPPVVEMYYPDDELACEISATAFSPLIAGDYESSNLPVAVFVYHLKNPTNQPIEASVVFSFQNNIGWSDTKNYEGTFNLAFHYDQIRGILFQRGQSKDIPEEHNGQIAIATLDEVGEVSYLKEWDTQGDGSDLFAKFCDEGALGAGEKAVEKNKARAGAIAVKVELAAGQERDIPFFLCWYCPKMDLRDVDVTSFGTVRDGKEVHFELGGWSQNFTKYVKDIDALVAKAKDSYLGWWERIYSFHKKMASSGTPSWLVSRYFHDLTYIPRWTFWIYKGDEEYFLVQEGQFGNGLCTVDVDGYNWLVLWWPRLELMEMKQLAMAQYPSGESVQELAMYPGSHGHLEAMWFTIRCWQDYVWTGDEQFLQFVWPYVKKTIEYTLAKEFDARTGLVKVDFAGVNSYDSWRVDGLSVYGNSQWLIVLKAAAKMAQIQKEFELSEKYQKMFEKAQKNFVEQLWAENGRWGYFKLCTGDVWDRDVSAVEQLIGVYWGDHLGFEVLPANYVRVALDTIYNLNGMGQLGWVCGRFPDGRVPLWDRTLVPPASKMQHSGRNRGTAQWQLASLLVTQGRIEDGIKTGEFIYNMESTRREVSLWTYPYYLCYFQENGEFGGYFPMIYTSYPRMGSWGYYVACAGAVATEKGLYIKPRVRFDSERQEYFVHWAGADVTILAGGTGERIALVKVNGKEWENIDSERGVFLPAELGKKGGEIKVEIQYQ